MVKIFRLIVIVLALLLLAAIFLPGCNNSVSSATNANPIIPVFTTDISNIKTASKDNNVIVENIDSKEQWTKFCNDLRLNYNKK
jgi:PBP1b-binding outer membrane lipoprotein LpoB